MKYLSDYCEQGIKDILNKYGAFYAFNTEQFNEEKQEGVKYVNLRYGLIAPEEHAEKVVVEMIDNFDKAVKQDIEENGLDAIIRRELYNHEAFYTGSIESTSDSLCAYPITDDDIIRIYIEERMKQEENE
jgi:hypothetical protein